jgi:hypothetical protein
MDDNSHISICKRNSNSIVSDSKREADDNVNGIHSGGDAEQIWEQNTICPEFHQCTGTSSIQPSFTVNEGVGWEFMKHTLTKINITRC